MQNKGITLAEILLAMVIISVAALAVLQSYIADVNLSQVNKEDVVAAAHLNNVMEAIKCTPFSDITVDFPNGVAGGSAGNNYADLVGGYALNNEQLTVSYINPNADPLEITASVTWRDIRGANHTRYLVTKKTR